jgi:predicted site-specific integrase-resolvase
LQPCMTPHFWVASVPPREVAKNLGVSIPMLYRWIPASGIA